MAKYILDGGMARELERMGAPFRQPEWSALSLIETPDLVREAHTRFIDAGARVITTNCYSILPFHIGQERFDANGRAWIKLSAQIAREAADASEHDVKVAASLPPLFGSYRPDLFDAAAAPALMDAFIEEQAEFVDLWLAETLCSCVEAKTVCDGLVRYGSDLPLWLAYCPTKGDWKQLHKGEAQNGETLDDVIVYTRDETPAEAILFNCCPMETAENAIKHTRELLGADQNLMIGAYPNLFKRPSIGANVGITPLRTDEIGPNDYAEYARIWDAAGADILGGCCGVSPEYIAAIKTFD